MIIVRPTWVRRVVLHDCWEAILAYQVGIRLGVGSDGFQPEPGRDGWRGVNPWRMPILETVQVVRMEHHTLPSYSIGNKA